MGLTTGQTVSEIAAGSLAAVRVFEAYGIDFCCGGKRPLEEVCREKGLRTDKVLERLEKATAERVENETDWTTAPLRELIRHIVGKHHEYLKLELPRLAQRLAKVVQVYGVQDAKTLGPVPELFGVLRQEMELHMHKEELMLFPAIDAGLGGISNAVAVMEREHDSAGDNLRKIRESLNDFAIPEYACVTYKSLLNGLLELEADLHLHIHLENNILFPRAIALERASNQA
jgi:regulator of cell morphogenesis and NO signaling